MLAVCLIQNGGKSRLWSPIGARFLYRRMWVKKKKISKKSAGHFSGLRKTIRIVFFGRKNNWHKKLTKALCRLLFLPKKTTRIVFRGSSNIFKKNICLCTQINKNGGPHQRHWINDQGNFFFFTFNYLFRYFILGFFLGS